MKKLGYQRIYNRFFKRIIDFIVAFFLLIVALPFFVIISFNSKILESAKKRIYPIPYDGIDVPKTHNLSLSSYNNTYYRRYCRRPFW